MAKRAYTGLQSCLQDQKDVLDTINYGPGTRCYESPTRDSRSPDDCSTAGSCQSLMASASEFQSAEPHIHTTTVSAHRKTFELLISGITDIQAAHY